LNSYSGKIRSSEILFGDFSITEPGKHPELERVKNDDFSTKKTCQKMMIFNKEKVLFKWTAGPFQMDSLCQIDSALLSKRISRKDRIVNFLQSEIPNLDGVKPFLILSFCHCRLTLEFLFRKNSIYSEILFVDIFHLL